MLVVSYGPSKRYDTQCHRGNGGEEGGGYIQSFEPCIQPPMSSKLQSQITRFMKFAQANLQTQRIKKAIEAQMHKCDGRRLIQAQQQSKVKMTSSNP